MAYNADNYERVELFNISKGNRGDAVVGTKVTNKTSGNVSVDIRQYYTSEDGELRPTSKGVRFSAEILLDVMKGLLPVLEVDEIEDLADTLPSVEEYEEGDDEVDGE